MITFHRSHSADIVDLNLTKGGGRTGSSRLDAAGTRKPAPFELAHGGTETDVSHSFVLSSQGGGTHN
jgi:hypothetical protein